MVNIHDLQGFIHSRWCRIFSINSIRVGFRRFLFWGIWKSRFTNVDVGEIVSIIYERSYEGCSKFFHLENVIFAKKKFLSPNFRELHVFLSRYMLAKIFKKNVDVWYPQIVPGVWSLVTLHSAAAALKHLRSASRCWSLLTFIGQFWHNKSTV